MPVPAPPADWSQSFAAYSIFHAVVFVVILGLIGVWCAAGRRLLVQDELSGMKLGIEGREYQFRRFIAWTIIGSQSFIFIRRFVYFDLQDSLPLHMCRLGVWIAAWSLWTLDPRARSLTLFWGIGLSMQVLFTPFLTDGYGSMSFWIYWINHLQIVGVAIYDISVLGYRPKARDLRYASIAGVVFAITVFALNAILGTNYSYLGRGTHSSASIIDQLGPYPYRAIWISIGSLLIFCILYLLSRAMLALRVRVFKKSPPRQINASLTR